MVYIRSQQDNPICIQERDVGWISTGGNNGVGFVQPMYKLFLLEDIGKKHV